SSWTVVRRKWLSEQRFEYAAQQQTFDTYLQAVDVVDARSEALERAIRETAEQGPWRELVARLRCLRGLDTLTALALVAEIGDFSRFRTAAEFMAFVGLVPSEHSTGEKGRQGSITTVGNAHVRRLLVESAWHARRRAKVGYDVELSSAMSRLFPTPGSPTTVTSWTDRCVARSKIPIGSGFSSSRPTKGVLKRSLTSLPKRAAGRLRAPKANRFHLSLHGDRGQRARTRIPGSSRGRSA